MDSGESLEHVAQCVDAPSLEAFKARFGVSLGSLFWRVAALPLAGGLELDGRVPSNPSHYMILFQDSMIIQSYSTCVF